MGWLKETVLVTMTTNGDGLISREKQLVLTPQWLGMPSGVCKNIQS